ncbi:MAG TPA: 50S ribosomal protein L24 [Thermomicrobiales bacterium]|nr:50S ribosomal protein L24 [Thermomicrobiales bacterium]
MRKILSGDEIVVIAGRNKGSRGTVQKVLIEADRVVVEGVNIVKKHIKRGRAMQSGIIETEAPLHVSNLMVVCPSCGEPSRIGVRRNDEGKNERFCKKCDAAVAQAGR